MTKKIPIALVLLIIFLYSTVIHAKEFKYVQIFDPKQAKVVKSVQLNTEIYDMVANWIKNIDGIYGKNDPVTNDGYAIKIPVYPAIKLHGKYFDTLVNEVYIIIPKNEPPFFMIFENSNKLICYPFKGDVDILSKALNFKLKSR